MAAKNTVDTVQERRKGGGIREPWNLTKLKKAWARNNQFNVYWIPTGKKWNDKSLGDIQGDVVPSFPYSVISTQLPDFTDTPMEEYLAGDWMISRGRRETYQISVTLRAPASMTT